VAERQIEGLDGIKKPLAFATGFNIILSVSPNDDDCAALERIFQSRWTVTASATVAAALSLFRKISLPIVICDCEITSGTWSGMLDQISLLPDPPLFIVTSRLADECLWAEALNLGAWDVLAKPFDADEVVRVIGAAGQHWRGRHDICISRTKQRKSANGTGELAANGT